MLSPLVLLVLLAGCQTTEITAVKTVLAVQKSVDNAMEEYAVLVRAGAVSLPERRMVREEYEKYEKIEEQVLVMLEMSAERAPAPTQLIRAADFLIELLILLNNDS